MISWAATQPHTYTIISGLAALLTPTAVHVSRLLASREEVDAGLGSWEEGEQLYQPDDVVDQAGW